MNIDITDFFNNAAPMDYSASVAEIGNNAGQLTWCAACDDAPDYPMLDTDEKRQAFRDYIKGFGAWDIDEIAAWSNDELTALFIQFVAGEMREHKLSPAMTISEWIAYQSDENSGRIFRADDGKIYYYIGD